MTVGINTFGLQEKLREDFEGTLAELRRQGYGRLEVCLQLARPTADFVPPEGDTRPDREKWEAAVWPLTKAAERLQAVREKGFVVDGCHLIPPVGLTPEMLRELIPAIVAQTKKLSFRYCVMSLMLETEAMHAYVDVLKEAVAACEQEGVCFLYHNHDMECVSVGGLSAMNLLLEACPKLQFELDLGWLMIGGVDPVAFLRQHADRIKLLHFKDFSRIAPTEQCMRFICAVGEGSLPLSEIADAAKNCPLEWGS